MILHNRQQINFILIIFFLLVTFINLIKQESETNRCFDCSDYSKNAYPGCVVDLKEYPDLSIYKNYPADLYRISKIPINVNKKTLDQTTLKYSIHYHFDNYDNISITNLPKTQILKVLQKKNICHKSSDDPPAPFICC